MDIALRLGPLADSSLKLRPLGMSRRVLVASPAYLEQHGCPGTTEALAGHEGIRMSNIAGSEALALEGPDGKLHRVPIGGRLRINHGLAAREALLAGRGIGPAPIWLVDDLLTEGRLETVLPDHVPAPVPLNMLIVPERADVARVRLLAEFLANEIGHLPGIRRP